MLVDQGDEVIDPSLAVVAPDQDNLREVLNDGENALLVPPEDGDALREAMVRLVTKPEDCARLGRAARRTIEEDRLTWDANVDRVLAAVEELR